MKVRSCQKSDFFKNSKRGSGQSVLVGGVEMETNDLNKNKNPDQRFFFLTNIKYKMKILHPPNQPHQSAPNTLFHLLRESSNSPLTKTMKIKKKVCLWVKSTLILCLLPFLSSCSCAEIFSPALISCTCVSSPPKKPALN